MRFVCEFWGIANVIVEVNVEFDTDGDWAAMLQGEEADNADVEDDNDRFVLLLASKTAALGEFIEQSLANVTDVAASVFALELAVESVILLLLLLLLVIVFIIVVRVLLVMAFVAVAAMTGCGQN